MELFEGLTEEQSKALYRKYLNEEFYEIMELKDFVKYAKEKGLVEPKKEWEQLTLDL